jgi:mRNA interferase RelE/StbE
LAYRVEITRTAQKQLLALPGAAQIEIALSIDSLVSDPRPPGCKKLRGTGLRRLRTGQYRVIYAIDDKAHLVSVLKVAVRREDTYQGL